MGTEQVAGQRPLVLLPGGVSEAGRSKADSRAGHAGSEATVASAGHAAWVNPTLSLELA